MPISHEIIIPMKGFPWAAPTFSKTGAYDSKANKKTTLRWLIKQAWPKNPITNPVEVCLYFAFKPPISASKSKIHDMVAGGGVESKLKHSVKPDLDNCCKATIDCLKGSMIYDDNQVFKISAEKYYAESDHIKIIIIDHGV